MRKMSPVFIIVVCIIIALVEYYSFSTIKFATRNLKPNYKQLLLILYVVLTLLWFACLLYMPTLRTEEVNKTFKNVIVSFFMAFLIMKLLITVILLIDDVRRVFMSISTLFFKPNNIPSVITKGMSRSQFMQAFALLLGGGIFTAFIAGMRNRYRYQVIKHNISFSTLPHSFNGLKIIHISDIHSGSFNDIKAVQHGIDMINAQQADVVFFTGDLVNNKSSEMHDYVDVFKQIKAPMGVFSSLGNHDYGDYVSWQSEEEKIKNLDALKKIHTDMGWRLLLNEHITLQKNNEEISVIGVENIAWKGRFHSYGSLEKAYSNVNKDTFKILLSHDPSHWDGEVNKQYKDIQLTLAGHTHGMQFGIEIPGFKWSPIKYVYKRWAGLYNEAEQYIHVNRGFGFLGYPGRVGILPEITVITLTT